MDIEELWAELKATRIEGDAARERFEATREALVSQLCACYRIDEEWEARAVWCVQRMTDTCPYFIELRKRNS